jgi:hypothetical protein
MKTEAKQFSLAKFVVVLMGLGIVYAMISSPSKPTPPAAFTAAANATQGTPEQKAADTKALAERLVHEHNVDRAISGARAIKNSLRDPDSVQWRYVQASPDGFVCYDYTATNAFGGRVRAAAVITKDGHMLGDSNSTRATYNKHCGDKAPPTDDLTSIAKGV